MKKRHGSADVLRVAERHFRTGNHSHAKAVLEKFVATNTSFPKAYEILGYIYGNENNLLLAHHFLEMACQLPQHSAEALYYLGVSYLRRNQPELALSPLNRAVALGRPFFEALHDLGTAHALLGDRRSALENYAKAAELRPNSFDLLFNIGRVYDEVKDFGNAILYYERAIRLDPTVADVWAHKGAALYDSKYYQEAITAWERALSIRSDIPFLPGFLAHARLRSCDWSKWDSERSYIIRSVREGKSVCAPFEILALSSSEEINQRASERWVAEKLSSNAPAVEFRKPAQDKIRIGYFSADFCRHAVSYLTAELYELHDRGKFEIFAFALEGAQKGDDMRERLTRSFDRFIDVQGKSDDQIATLSRNLGIDIAIDLGGHTKGGRAGVFSNRAAPIQVNYLGYPGTMGAKFIDYIIADRTVVPDGSEQYYTEKIVVLPNSFQPSDTARSMGEAKRSRGEYGLPDTGFVFCCFNNPYKINPEIFESWMRILERVDGSCLWLLSDVEAVGVNLRNEARRRGIDSGRLVFGGYLPMDEYLCRYRLADLFLDTLPFNGGTTANDALWAGLPVITRPGGSFAGRMASSLLKAIELPELIVETTDAYEATAVRLAQEPDELVRIKDRLTRNRRTGPLFDMARYTRQLETAYHEMYRRFQEELPRDHIYVAAGT